MQEETLQQQMQLLEQLTENSKLQIATFEKAINGMVNGVPKEHQQEVAEFQNIVKRSILLAKQGKANEAQELIKKAQNERKNNR